MILRRYELTREWLDEHITEIDTMDISPVVAPEAAPESKRIIYDLAGRKLSNSGLKHSPSGIYIVNGKKIVKGRYSHYRPHNY